MDEERERPRRLLAILGVTIVRGVIFLLPLILIAWIIGKALRLAGRLTAPVAERLDLTMGHGLAIATILQVAALVLICLLVGLVARTRAAHALTRGLHRSFIGELPPFALLRGLGDGLITDKESVPVVLVASGAGLTIGFVFGSRVGAYTPVFLPKSPHWQKGSVPFVHDDNLKNTDISLGEAALIMLRRGGHSEKILTQLNQEPGLGLRPHLS